MFVGVAAVVVVDFDAVDVATVAVVVFDVVFKFCCIYFLMTVVAFVI